MTDTHRYIIDAHVHMVSHSGIDALVELACAAGIARINIVCTPGSPERSLNCNAAAMLAKALHPEIFYAFGGLHYDAGQPTTAQELRRQAEELWAAGCDGIKMLEGKPTSRKRIPFRMDDPVYDEYYAFLQEARVPIVWHVADPASFWDPARVPEMARRNGWDYTDGTFPSKEQLYEEVDNVLSRFPSLRAIFAHFAFLSEKLEYAEAFLERYPGVCLDITPGSEMYRDFSKCPDRWRELFNRYQDRIIFGTDNVAPGEPWDRMRGNMLDKVGMMRRFLESDEEFEGFCTANSRFVKGLGLDGPVLDKIYSRNFEDRVGAAPRPLDVQAALRQCRQVLDYARREAGQSWLLNEMQEIEAAFLAR